MARTPNDPDEAALDAYFALVRDEPELFGPRRSHRLVLDRAQMRAYAEERAVRLGVLAATPYLWLLNDLVATQASGDPVIHPYLRQVAPPGRRGANGVVVVATAGPPGAADSRVVLVETERHATGRMELELPRGFGAVDRDSRAQAAAELLEETGYVAGELHHLGCTLTDSGLSDAMVDYFHTSVSRTAEARPEPTEGLVTVRTLSVAEAWSAVRDGTIRDGFTVQALGLYANAFPPPTTP